MSGAEGNGFGRRRFLAVGGGLAAVAVAGCGAPTDWSDPSAFTQGLTAMQFTGLWTLPAIEKAFPDDFGVLPGRS